MILDIRAVSTMEGVDTSLTWAATGIYTPPADSLQTIPGRLVSGTITGGETFIQDTTEYEVVEGGYTDGEHLFAGPRVGGDLPSPAQMYIGQTSGSVFQPIGIPAISSTDFVYVNPLFGHPYIIQLTNQNAPYDGRNFTLVRNPKQGDTMLYLRCALPTFTIPPWCRSWSLRNISGASLYFRRYAPNLEANVIDTAAVTFGEDGIVGQELAAGQPIGFANGDFSPGSSYVLCAAAQALNGAIVDFYP